MPSVGTRERKSRGSTRGAPSAYTEAGPPLRIRACGRIARTCSSVTVCGTSTEYTRHSRTRRAISCAYCPPRSTTSTGRSSGPGSGRLRTSASAPIVRRLLRDRHVVRMRLPQARGADAHEPGVVHLVDRRRAAVTHRLPQPADELVDDRSERPLVRDAPLDSLRHELVHRFDVALEIAILRETRAHRAERRHAA